MYNIKICTGLEITEDICWFPKAPLLFMNRDYDIHRSITPFGQKWCYRHRHCPEYITLTTSSCRDIFMNDLRTKIRLVLCTQPKTSLICDCGSTYETKWHKMASVMWPNRASNWSLQSKFRTAFFCQRSGEHQSNHISISLCISI